MPLALTGGAVLALVAVLLDDLVFQRLPSPPSTLEYALVGVAMLLGAVGPWLARPARSRLSFLRLESRALVLGTRRIAADDVEAVSLATAHRGTSVGLRLREGLLFLEVERASDARRVIDALGKSPEPIWGVGKAPAAWGQVAVLQVATSVMTALFAFLHQAATILPDAAIGAKAFGVPAVVLAALSFVVLARRVASGARLSFAKDSALDVHARLHASEREHDVGVGERGPLVRREEPTAAWLARLDAAASAGSAYRGDVPARDALVETLGDEAARVDERMAAARLLKRRHGVEAQELVRIVVDPEVRVRVEAALEEDVDAAERIDALGPIFHVRR